MALPLFFYLYIYCLTLIGFFLLLSISFWVSKDKDLNITGIFTFFNPSRNFIFSVFFIIYLLSFSGLPIFIGFLAKGSLSYFFVSTWSFGIFFFSSIINTLSFFYTLRLLRMVYFDIVYESIFSLADENWDFYRVASYSYFLIFFIIFLMFFTIFFFLTFVFLFVF
jgi:NADH:ubiquinone oxidoreductase subunit 2 (subunit N)